MPVRVAVHHLHHFCTFLRTLPFHEEVARVFLHLPAQAEAQGAADLAVALINGKTAKTNGTTDNGTVKVPSVLLVPVGITKSNVKVVIADGFQKKADVCKGIEKLCTANGIK